MLHTLTRHLRALYRQRAQRHGVAGTGRGSRGGIRHAEHPSASRRSTSADASDRQGTHDRVSGGDACCSRTRSRLESAGDADHGPGDLDQRAERHPADHGGDRMRLAPPFGAGVLGQVDRPNQRAAGHPRRHLDATDPGPPRYGEREHRHYDRETGLPRSGDHRPAELLRPDRRLDSGIHQRSHRPPRARRSVERRLRNAAR